MKRLAICIHFCTNFLACLHTKLTTFTQLYGSFVCITFSWQFHRSFPGPAEVTPAEISALAQYYYDLATGLHNYLQFHNDIVSLGGGEGGAKKCEPFTTDMKVPLILSIVPWGCKIKKGVSNHPLNTLYRECTCTCLAATLWQGSLEPGSPPRDHDIYVYILLAKEGLRNN